MPDLMGDRPARRRRAEPPLVGRQVSHQAINVITLGGEVSQHLIHDRHWPPPLGPGIAAPGTRPAPHGQPHTASLTPPAAHRQDSILPTGHPWPAAIPTESALTTITYGSHLTTKSNKICKTLHSG